MPTGQSYRHDLSRALLQRLVVGLLLVVSLVPEGYSLDLPVLQDLTAELRAGDLPSGVPELNDPHDEEPSLAPRPSTALPRPVLGTAPPRESLRRLPALPSPCQPRAPPTFT